MRTGSSAKTTISLSSKVTDSIRFVDTLRYEHVYSHKAAQKKEKKHKNSNIQSSLTSNKWYTKSTAKHCGINTVLNILSLLCIKVK